MDSTGMERFRAACASRSPLEALCARQGDLAGGDSVAPEWECCVCC